MQMSRTESFDQEAIDLLSHWEVDLTTRKLGRAVTEDGEIETDLDLATLLGTIAARHGVVSLPHYRGRRQKTQAEGEVNMPGVPRYGQIVALTSNARVHAFGFRVRDYSVVENQTPGAYRTFLATDLDGSLYDGWDRIDFHPTAAENRSLAPLWNQDGAMSLRHFVHPNRWTAFYGAYYRRTKALIERLADEASFCRREQREIIASGVEIPARPAAPRKVVVGEAQKIKVTALQVVMPIEFVGEYAAYPRTRDGYDAAAARVRDLRSLLERLRYYARTVELAFFLHATERAVPRWAACEVTAGFREKRTVYDQRLTFSDGHELRWRLREVTETVAADESDESADDGDE